MKLNEQQAFRSVLFINNALLIESMVILRTITSSSIPTYLRSYNGLDNVCFFSLLDRDIGRSESSCVVTGFIVLRQPLWLITLAVTSFLLRSFI